MMQEYHQDNASSHRGKLYSKIIIEVFSTSGSNHMGVYQKEYI